MRGIVARSLFLREMLALLSTSLAQTSTYLRFVTTAMGGKFWRKGTISDYTLAASAQVFQKKISASTSA